ncbi:MAG: response regulator, partial [Bdellovibrionales bacterium]|nr:response regulator [Bdellovibrionales bacterium]
MSTSESNKEHSNSNLSERVKESLRLSRSMAKILAEARHLGADSLQLVMDGATIRGSVLRDKQELKQVSMQAHWFEPLYAWLAERRSVVLSENSPRSSTRVGADGSASFYAVLRVVDSVLHCRVERSSYRGSSAQIKLSAFQYYPLKEAIRTLGADAYAQEFCERLTTCSSGLVVIASPDVVNLESSIVCAQSFLAPQYLGELTDEINLVELAQLCAQEFCMLSLRSDDAISVLLKLRNTKVDLKQLNLLGVICQGFVKANCPSCSKETVVNRSAADMLPPALMPDGSKPYLVGRGCKECGLTGSKGLLAVQSILSIDSGATDFVIAHGDYQALVEFFYARGCVSLLEDGVKKVLEGRATLEHLFKFVSVAPDAYLRLLARSPKRKNGAEDALDVKGDFFASPEQLKITKPTSGKAAFNPHAANDQDSPLFAVGPGGKVRERPLLLVVEDDPDQRSILEMVLRSAHYDVISAADGEQGMQFVERERPDLVVSDLMMP